MNSPLGITATLRQLDRLKHGIADCRNRAGQLDEESKLHRTKLDQQHARARRLTEEQLASAQVDVRAQFAHRRKQADARQGRRQARLTEARQGAEAQRLKGIAERESRGIFRIQRDLLQVTRDRDAARQLADTALKTFQADWTTAHHEADVLTQRMAVAFRGYAAFRRLLTSPPDPPAVEAGEDGQLLAAAQEARQDLDRDLTRFRRRPFPLLFRIFSPWLVAALLLAGHAAAVPLLKYFRGWEIPWEQAGVSAGAALVGLFLLHGLTRQLNRARAVALATALSRVYALLDASELAARGRHQQEHQRIQADTERRTAELEREWNSTTAEAESKRGQLQEQLGHRLQRAVDRSGENHRRLIERLAAEEAAALERLQEGAAAEQRQLETQRQSKAAQIAANQTAARQQITTDWTELTGAVWENFTVAQTTATTLFPAWTDPVWDQWTPPREFAGATPLGRLDVDLAVAAGGLPPASELPLPGSGRLELPLLLTFPGQGSLLIQTETQGRELALHTLNNLVLRLLTSAPPGRVLFTILDPVGLGESFAGLMHLTDHEDRLINRRIWTQPEQIEQRLADLGEHVEKVTQLYLRNEFRTIAEYNAEAGRVAEPYHFVVIADFPVGFSELAVRRLLALASSGPRCGVFTLVHWDRRRPAPAEFVPEDLRRASVSLEAQGNALVLAGQPATGATVVLESPPDPARFTALLQQVGQSSIDSNRVEMPFKQIAPPEGAMWSQLTTAELRVPIGVTGATKLQMLALGKGTRQHALIAGKTGSGKSTLFHVLITNLALWCSPDDVEFYLVDFKKGVEFKCYATHRLPHARVVAIESDREFGLSVLQRVDQELQNRGDLFRQLGVQDLAGYQRTGGDRLPRTLLVIDEFQEFFTDDDRVSQQAALLLDRLVRQGRAFGIHVLLGSQTLGGAYTLARPTLGQMVVRVALQCNQADALLIMDEDNPAPRLLSRPGEAIYNDASGALEGNSPFQIVWLPEPERETWLNQIRDRAAATPPSRSGLVVFEGNAPADAGDNPELDALLRKGPSGPVPPAHIWLGAPNAIQGPTRVTLRRQTGNNLLVVGQNDEAALGMLGLALLALTAQHPPGSARFLILDATPPETPHRRWLEAWLSTLSGDITSGSVAQLDTILADLAAELELRSDPDRAAAAPTVYLFIHHLERFKGLRYEDDFSLSLDAGAAQSPGAVLNRVLTEGTHGGLHVICTCDGLSNVTRFLSRKALNEFDLRVLFQMSASDSASLIDDPKASLLGLHRALLHNAQAGTLETFRPYALPEVAWARGLRG